MEVHKEDVMTILDLDEAEKYVGELGYFASRPYKSLGSWERGVLAEVLKHEEVESVFYAVDEDGDEINYFGLFIPAEKVKEVQEIKDEKKWRPFKNCKELCQYIRVTGEDLYAGLTINIRNKENKIVRQVLVTEINYDKPFIGLGISLFDLENLYRSYEWQDEKNEDWKPFGVEE